MDSCDKSEKSQGTKVSECINLFYHLRLDPNVTILQTTHLEVWESQTLDYITKLVLF